MTHVIAALPGDGIGPEVIAAAVEVLEWCGRNHGLPLEVRTFPAGGAALDRYQSVVKVPRAPRPFLRPPDKALRGSIFDHM